MTSDITQRNEPHIQVHHDDRRLAELMRDLVRGSFPPSDGVLEVVPPPPRMGAAILAFTAHHVIAADVAPDWVAKRCSVRDYAAPLSPGFLMDLSVAIGYRPEALDIVLRAPASGDEPDVRLERVEWDDHPRVQRAQKTRSDLAIYRTHDGQGVLSIGKGLGGRWEGDFDVEPAGRNSGLGRQLAQAARCFIRHGETVFLQVAAGNIASLRAVLAAGFKPVGAQVRFIEQEEERV